MEPTSRCPCGSGDVYGDCCLRFHSGALTAPTAESLMRSRYSAFALGDAAYLLETWHHTTRPAKVELDDDRRWLRLDVSDTVRGGPFDNAGVVEFSAIYRDPTGRGVLHERSTFTREHGRWSYVDGTVLP